MSWALLMLMPGNGDAHGRGIVDVHQIVAFTMFVAVDAVLDALRDGVYAIDSPCRRNLGVSGKLFCAFLDIARRIGGLLADLLVILTGRAWCSRT